MPHEYDYHWMCHECGKWLDTGDKVFVDEEGYIYHDAHKPAEVTRKEKSK